MSLTFSVSFAVEIKVNLDFVYKLMTIVWGFSQKTYEKIKIVLDMGKNDEFRGFSKGVFRLQYFDKLDPKRVN